jgi:CubicO group peptidase (beta-lactamase class C family)
MKIKKRLLISFIFCQNIVFGQDAGFTGYATSMITGDVIEYKTHGFRDKKRTQDYDTLTVQPIGSVSKIIIGLAIMKASELGMVNLEAGINQYLNFEVNNPNLKFSQQITLKHLATHTSGISERKNIYCQ